VTDDKENVRSGDEGFPEIREEDEEDENGDKIRDLNLLSTGGTCIPKISCGVGRYGYRSFFSYFCFLM
jgi:hypothetical protein